MPAPIGRDELERRVRSFGGGSARATHSLIDRAVSQRHQTYTKVQECTLPCLTHASASGIVKLARTFDFSSRDLAKLFTYDINIAAAFLFAAALRGRCGPLGADDASWAGTLAEAHSEAMYHLRSQLWNGHSKRLASGETMDEILRMASDRGSLISYSRHAMRLGARLRTLTERHMGPAVHVVNGQTVALVKPATKKGNVNDRDRDRDQAQPARVNHTIFSSLKWGYTAGRLPRGYWPKSYESSDMFDEIVEKIAAERMFSDSLRCARLTFALNSPVGMVDFNESMSVMDQMLECDLREIHRTNPKLEDFILSVSALRASIAKNIWSEHFDATRAGTEIEVYRNDGWFPAFARDVAQTLVATTIWDLHAVWQSAPPGRERDCEGASETVKAGHWLQDTFTDPFVSTTSASTSRIIERVEHALVSATFFASLHRASNRVRVETVDPLVAVKALPTHEGADGEDDIQRHQAPNDSGDGSAAIMRCGGELAHTDEIDDDLREFLPDVGGNGGDAGNEHQPSERRPVSQADGYASSDSYEGSHDDLNEGLLVRSEGGSIASTLFVERGVHGAPPLTVRDTHEDMAAFGGAVCFKLDETTRRWLVFANQEHGSVHITSVQRYLGYRGFGRSTFLVEAYGPDGHFHAGNVVAVVSYNRTRLEARVATAMDAMEGLPVSLRRENQPMFPPYISRWPAASERLRGLACNYVTPFEPTAACAVPESLQVMSHTRRERSYTYQTADGNQVELPCEGWGHEPSDHLRSSVRAFWARELEAACPHDMKMRLTRSSTHVMFSDGQGRAVHKKYRFTPRTIMAIWDGRITFVAENEHSITYVMDNDLPGAKYRVAIVAGFVSCSQDVPLSIARMIEELWRLRGQTCPHAPAEAGICFQHDAGTSSGMFDLVQAVDLTAAEAPAWLAREAETVSFE